MLRAGGFEPVDLTLFGVAVRNCRREALDHLRKAEKDTDSGISQEDEKRAQERLQKLTDQFIKRVEEVSRQKETEVMEV